MTPSTLRWSLVRSVAAHVGLQQLLECEVREEEAVADAAPGDQVLRHLPVLLRAVAPIGDLFGNVNH